MSQTLTKPILLDETGQAIKTALQNIDETESQDWLLSYEDVHSELDDNIKRIADALEFGESYPTKIKVITPPTKRSYDLNEPLDMSGIVVCADMTNGVTATLSDITDMVTFSPVEGTPITSNNNVITITWNYAKTSQTFTTTFTVSILPKVVSWTSGSDAEIVAMLNAHYDPDVDFNVRDYWSVGETRTVHLNAINNTTPNLTDTHVAQDIRLVLTQVGGKYLSDGVTECAFQVDQDNILLEQGAMSMTATHAGGWGNSQRRDWCNSLYRNAFPDPIKGIFKQFKNKYVGDSQDKTIHEVDDYFSLRSLAEVFPKSNWIIASSDIILQEGNLCKHYETSTNRIKKFYDGSAPSVNRYDYWCRTPRIDSNTTNTGFISIMVAHYSETSFDALGDGYNSQEDSTDMFLAPYGCI